MKRLETALQSDPLLQHSSGGGLFRTPIFTKEVLVDILNEMEVSHVTCNSETIGACVGLAAYLRCPLIANSCELFLFDFEEPVGRLDRFLYIPLRYISTKPVSHSSITDCMCLVAHVFSPSKCSLHRIPYMLRPFFCIFFKPPTCSHFPLPYRIFSILRREKDESTSSVRPMVQRARELISWLESAKSPLEVLEESVRQLEDKKVIISFIEELVYLAIFFKIDLNQGEELAKYLFPDARMFAPYHSDSADLFTCLVQEPCPEHLKQFISLIETERSLAGCEATDMLSKLPQCFLRLYRSGFLSTVLFSRLLSNEVLLPVLEENMNYNAASDCSASLRFLQYCVGRDFLKRYAYQIEHLESSAQPTVSEISRSNDASHFTLSTVQLISLTPSTNCGELSEICTSFIRLHTGCQLKSVNNWIEMLALTLTLWHSSKHPSTYLDILEQPTALAIALVTCAVVASGGRLTSQHLNQLASEMPCGYDVDILHEISELQLLYISLLSLIRFVGVVSVCESNSSSSSGSNLDIGTVKVPQGDQFFPSSHLIHNLAAALAESPERKSLSIWINKVLSPVENAEITQNATLNMIMLTRSLCGMRTVQPIEFVSGSKTLPFPQSEHRSASHGDHKWQRNERPSHNRAVPPERGSNMRAGRGGEFTDPNAGQRVFANKMSGNLANGGNGEFVKLSNQGLRQFGPKKSNFGENDGKRAFANKGGPIPRISNDSCSKWNKEPTFLLRPEFTHSNGLREKSMRGRPIASEFTNPFLVEDSSSGFNFKSSSSCLANCGPKVGCASSECGDRAMNDRDTDARKSSEVAASEYGFKLSSGFKRQSMNSRPGSIFAYTNNRSGYNKPWANPSANRQRFVGASKNPKSARPPFSDNSDEFIRPSNAYPDGDTADPRNLDNQTEAKFRKNFENANSRQQGDFQRKLSFYNFENRDSNFKANCRKPVNGVPRRAGFQKRPQDHSLADIQSKWSASGLIDEIDRLASQFA